MTYYLLRYPTIYRKLQHEIRSAFKAYDEINANSTTDLEYLHAVALEAMRMYAPLPFALPRVVPEGGDTVDGHFLPAGVSLLNLKGLWKPLTVLFQTIVSTNPTAASLSSANFESPFEFRPERWLGEKKNNRDVLEAAQPFSLGPRGCLGRK